MLTHRAHLCPSLSTTHLLAADIEAQLGWMAQVGQANRTQGGALLGCLPAVRTLPGAPGSPGEDKKSRQED